MSKYIFYLLIFLNIFLASRWVIDGNILFHTDIARDFLLIEDIVENQNPTLIGPRSGAIPGLFHGPLWLYLNLPAYASGGGDPAVVGWFWVGLFILSLFTTYFMGKKMFGAEVGILSALLLSSVTILNVRSLFNPYGALILFPLFFYTFSLYLKKRSIKTLVLSLFLLGLIIQFQMAFGVPILISTLLYLLYFLYKKKKLSHLISLFILLIPLSSFLLFDIRNNFLQTKSIISYILGAQSHGKLDLNLIQLITLRIKELIVDGFGIITQGNIYLTLFLFLSFIFIFFLSFKQKKYDVIILFFYFYLSFWFMSIFFKGPLWNYYYLPFIPLMILIFVSLKERMNKIFFYSLFFLIYFVNLQNAIKDLNSYNPNPLEQDVSTWKFNKLVAEKIFVGSESEFGYFIFTPDLYGYSPRFALNFYEKKYKNKMVYPYQKKTITYLIIAPPPEYGKDPNSVWYQKNINSTSWKISDVKIDKDPQDKFVFKNGFIIERYELSPDEISIKPNPNLIKDIFFR